MNLARFLGKALADIIAIGLDLTAQLDKRRAQLGGRQRRGLPARAPDPRRHQRLLDLRVAAIRAGDLARLLLGLEAVAIAEPALEFVARSAAQGKEDHREDLRMRLSTPTGAPSANIYREC